MPLTRRAALGLLPAAGLATARLIRPASAAPTPVLPPAGRLAFSVWRQGSRIGTHTVAFSRAGDRLTVDTNAHFSVALGPINLFSYTYRVTEVWIGGVLDNVSAQTNDNGARGTCTARRHGGRLQVNGSKSGLYTAPAGSIAGTHWNQAELKAPMIDPENGALMTFAVADQGTAPPPGGGIPAHRYALTGFATLDTWYNDAGTWVGLKAVAKDKSIVEYHAA